MAIPFELPKPDYAYDALEPYIDAKTMEFHHRKHHAAYLEKFNAFLEKNPQLKFDAAEELLMQLNTVSVSEDDKKILRNHGGGYVNHSFFWKLMGPEKEIDEALAADVTAQFGSVADFKTIFGQAALSQFGSGWAWLVRDENKKLQVYALPNQDSPLSLGHIPILGLDVWEHAYYLKYQNRRAEYIENWWNVVKII
jgi:Fe-Mn family superoxide dismutase